MHIHYRYMRCSHVAPRTGGSDVLGQWQKKAPARHKDNLQIRKSQLLNSALPQRWLPSEQQPVRLFHLPQIAA